MSEAPTDWYLQCPRCLGVAYWLRRQLRPFEVLAARDFVRVDGTPATYGEIMRCGTCGTQDFPAVVASEGVRAVRALDVAVRPASELGGIQ